jgi:hypothetical protein
MSVDYNAGVELSQALANINASLATLRRLGASDKADAALDNATAPDTYAALDADTEHNTDWLRTSYARKYISVVTALARTLTRLANTTGGQDQDDAARVFGIKGLPGDVASLGISRRDAATRAEDIGPDNIKRLTALTGAARTGDDVLAHALVESAFVYDDIDTVNAFVDAYPALSDATERLWNAAHRKMTEQDVMVAWRIAALKPAPLKALQDYEIAAAAAGQTNVGTWNA